MMLLFLFAASIAISNAVLPGPLTTGVGTVFLTVDIDDKNNCEWEKTDPITNTGIFPFGEFAAVDTNFFGDAVRCGACFELSCVDKIDSWGACNCIADASVTVMAMDYGHDVFGYTDAIFDLPQTTADQILSGGDCADGSKYNIQYKQVCCDHRQDIAIFNYEGINARYLSFVVANVRGHGSITNLWMTENGKPEYECVRDTNGQNNNWVCDPWGDNPRPTGYEGIEADYVLPIGIRIRDQNGDELSTPNLINSFNDNDEFDFGKNFQAGCGTEPPQTTKPPRQTTKPPPPLTTQPKTTPPQTTRCPTGGNTCSRDEDCLTCQKCCDGTKRCHPRDMARLIVN